MAIQGSIFAKNNVVHVPSAQDGPGTKQPQPMSAA